MGTFKVLVLPGDGIGPEVTSSAIQVLESVGKIFGHSFHFTEDVVGGAAINAGTVRDFNHKNKKLNYVCSINPTTLSQLNIKITNSIGGNIFPVGGVSQELYLEFIIIVRE